MRRRPSMFLGPAALALCLLASACGGSAGDSAAGVATAGDGGKTTQASDGDKKTDPEQAGLDFAECMREHGVDLPDPSSAGGGFVVVGPTDSGGQPSMGAAAPAGFEEAHKACQHHLDGLIQDGGGTVDAEAQDKALKFAACMREHGVNMADPDFSKGGVQIGLGDTFDPTSETFKAAQKACGSLFGPGGGGAPVPAPRPRS
jgi:hypothetical protein